MSDEQATPSAAESHAGGRCVCEEVRRSFEKLFDVPPEVRQHLANSRIEFLKAIRAAIDRRIEHLSQPQQRGSRIAVE